MSHRTRITADAQHKHKSHRSRIPCRASLLVAAALITHALPNARGTRAGVHKRCHATSMLHCTLPTCAHPTYKAHAHALAGVHRCNRHAARPPRTPTAASPGRSPRLRRLAAALQARSQRARVQAALRPSHCRPQLRPSTKSLLLLPLLLKPDACTPHSQRGIAKVRDTRFYARRQPRTHGRRSHLRCDAPVGSRHADRGRHAAHDHDGDVGYRCALVGLEQDVRGHLRTAPCEQASSGTAGAAFASTGATACKSIFGRPD